MPTAAEYAAEEIELDAQYARIRQEKRVLREEAAA